MGLLFAFMVMALCATPSALSLRGSAVTVALPPRRLPQNLPNIQPVSPGHPPSILPDHTYSPIRSPHGSGRKSHGEVLPPPNKPHHISSTKHYSPTKGAHSHDAMRPSSITPAPSSLSSFRGPTKKWVHGPASSPFIPFHRHHHVRNKSRNSGSGPAYPTPAPSNSQQVKCTGPSVPSFQSPLPSSSSWSSRAPAPSPKATSGNLNVPSLRPTISPTSSSLKKMKTPPPSSVMTLPPPPPNEDCGSVTCTEPLTYTPPGSPCGCVWPIQVKLALDVPIYTFFPLVSQLTEEIAASVGLNHSQVRVMGANAASQQLQKSTALINLVPLGVQFDDTVAFLIFKKFWQRQVFIKPSLFGAYEVLYVHYPGLPPSPPSQSSISTEDDGPYAGRDNKRQALKPLGVEVPMRKKGGLRGSMIAAIVLSSFTALVLCFGIAVFLLKRGAFRQPEQTPHDVICAPAKLSAGATTTLRYGSMLSSSSVSIDSCAVTYTGTAKTFTLNDIEKATNGFHTSRIIGEGGFGVVYRGILDDGREVAVKVLKRANQHGGREFLAELEMLSRLHHRNLVKLFGVCIEDNNRCLVYELIHNGSLESHLHGDDKVNGPLDWDARMKIALGAARGLAYLHEDSSPRVIHRDFKSSNILLEHDFTPKVSDFGLARTALDEGNKHISTHVMGTFGYLAPEYAMTGHLLVKSDVYSYGVVLLELLTGRKPVDLSQPPGQENLVAWARPLLTTKEGLQTIIDPVIESNISYDTLVKVAAIASMCVQPEVSHRPFMGEVVQALKLVCNEFDETKETIESRDLSEDCSISVDSKVNRLSGEFVEALEVCHTRSGYGVGHDNSMAISASEMITPMGLEGQESGSFRRHSSSGPLRSEGRRQFWQILKSSSRGSMREHGFSSKFWPESH
ncbi:protein kinase domain-containing protein [Citrus sinensis]|uniref:receptor-like serine/threonine-protein kinase ALE2 isoform X1 n=1 Tax=Citrus clementina TaxID=85681 RepID=UPI000CED661B|nr:receptor-like serine/threonine-protein kinase ALE2 isoform X1 [Citrus x clementina]XP_024952841.2 receptor-like serine/threonine-protein kinase ALE2 isoform X1 [Citrus sinensis]XP_024952843.2 receptor-like serine/threonine-protein kinase ALE2 isoform X1 [Citrus sinensis]KAH9664969.1 protein kinase domain-containing protein [Citrus sinensis]